MQRFVNISLLLVYGLFIVGFWFHTSLKNALFFNKYSPAYFIGLCVFTFIIPFVLLFLYKLISNKILNGGKSSRLAFTLKLLIVVVGILIAGTGLEVYLLQKHHDSLLERQEKLKGFHPFLQNTPVAGDRNYHINRWGFRGEEIEKEKPENTYRIFMLGGSTVFCGNVPYGLSHCRLLEKRLRKKYPDINIEVQNAGTNWHTSQHSLIKFLIKIQDYDPDLIIAYHGINDLVCSFSHSSFETLAIGDFQTDYGHFIGPLFRMFHAYASPDDTGLMIVNKVKQLIGNCWLSDFTGNPLSRPEQIPVTEWHSLYSFRRNLSNLVNLVKMNDINMILASQPYLYRDDLTDEEKKVISILHVGMIGIKRVADIPSLIKGMDSYNLAARSIADENGILFVDLEKKVEKSLRCFVDDVHYTRYGNRKICEFFYDAIAESGMIEKRMGISGDSDNETW